MPLISCPECKKEILNKTATSCPSCGYPFDDDLKSILEKSEEEDSKSEQDNNKNTIATILNITAIIELICGFICIIYYGGVYTITDRWGTTTIEWDFLANPEAFFLWIVITFFSWLLLKVLSEIIQILHDIRENTNKKQ